MVSTWLQMLTWLHRITAVDRNRVRLTSIPGVNGSDYINGTHIDVSTSNTAAWVLKFW